MFLVVDQRLPRSDDLLLVREKLFGEFGGMEIKIRLANQVGGSGEADLHSGRVVRDDEAACRVLDPDIVGKPVNQRLQRNDFVDRFSLSPFFLIRAQTLRYVFMRDDPTAVAEGVIGDIDCPAVRCDADLTCRLAVGDGRKD